MKVRMLNDAQLAGNHEIRLDAGKTYYAEAAINQSDYKEKRLVFVFPQTPMQADDDFPSILCALGVDCEYIPYFPTDTESQRQARELSAILGHHTSLRALDLMY